ncbi:hypothetical protein BGZ58_002602 [Dissophora ornata]|nr:hypothetical protein BGZ58_002602 [Dissophora ornata]
MADNLAGKPAVSAADDAQDVELFENDDYDELVDEDWLDMDNPQQSARSKADISELSSAGDRQVPSIASPVDIKKLDGDALAPTASSSSSFSFHSDFEDTTPAAPTDPPSAAATASTITTPTTKATAAPFSLTVSTEDSPPLQAQEQAPGSNSPSSSSDSEYSLLGPSAEQSRKNSLSTTTGFHGLRPSNPASTATHLLQGLDHEHDPDDHLSLTVATSPSLSDFIQVGSDQGEDFSGIDSVSARSTSNKTLSSMSSDGKSSVDDDDETPSQPGPSSIAYPQEKNGRDESKNAQDRNVPEVAAAAETVTASALLSTSSPCASPARRTMYRTTVEDAMSSSEDERGSGKRASGLHYRGSRGQPDGREDVRRSFFSSPTPTSTMPGAFNVGLDAEIPPYGGAAAATATAVNDPLVDERQCRICLGGADEEDTLGRLISPCLCKGSMKYVHVECLNAWRARSPKRESHYKCDTCKYSFSFRRTSFARYLAHPLTVFVLTVVVFAAAVFAAGFAMKLLLYLMMDEPHEFIYPVDIDDIDDTELLQLKERVVIFKTPESLRAVFQIDKTHMVFGSFFVSIIGFLQLLLSMVWMGGGGGVFRIGGFGLGGGRRRARGERQREAGIGGVLMVLILVFGLFKSVYMTYQLVHRVSRRVLAKAEMMVLEVQ